MTHSSVRTQTPRLPVDCKHATEAGEFMTCASKTQASPACMERASPLTTDGIKKHFCCPLERKVVSKASHEQTWTRGANGRHTIPCNLGQIPADVGKLKGGFAQRRGLSRWLRGPPVPASYPSMLDSNQLKL